MVQKEVVGTKQQYNVTVQCQWYKVAVQQTVVQISSGANSSGKNSGTHSGAKCTATKQ